MESTLTIITSITIIIGIPGLLLIIGAGLVEIIGADL